MLTQQTLRAPSEIRQTEAHVLRFLSKIRPEAPKVHSRGGPRPPGAAGHRTALWLGVGARISAEFALRQRRAMAA
jgi:hypothetical protein